MEQWHIKGERLHYDDESPGVVQWKWQRLNPRGEVVDEAAKGFEDIAHCLKDAHKHGYCANAQ